MAKKPGPILHSEYINVWTRLLWNTVEYLFLDKNILAWCENFLSFLSFIRYSFREKYLIQCGDIYYSNLWLVLTNIYRLSKKSRPFSHRNFLYENGEDLTMTYSIHSCCMSKNLDFLCSDLLYRNEQDFLDI